MKLQAKINDKTEDVELARTGDEVTAKVGDRKYVLDLTQPEPNVYAFRNGAEMVEVFVSPAKQSEITMVSAKDHTFEIELIDPKRLRGSGLGSDDADGTAEIKTSMPGKVVRLLVETGAEVKKGDGVIVVEAMKMQNEMKAPKDGVIADIKAAEGQTVNAGDVLVVIE